MSAMICHSTTFAAPLMNDPVPVPYGSDSSARAADEAALVLWLRWNDAFEKVNRELYSNRQDPETLEVLLSQLDSLRQEAVRRTEAALNAAAEA
jgi:hypothetical protein